MTYGAKRTPGAEVGPRRGRTGAGMGAPMPRTARFYGANFGAAARPRRLRLRHLVSPAIRRAPVTSSAGPRACEATVAQSGRSTALSTLLGHRLTEADRPLRRVFSSRSRAHCSRPDAVDLSDSLAGLEYC